MPGPVLILGGYGNFGKRIARGLINEGIPVIIAGRDERKAAECRDGLFSSLASHACFDINRQLADALENLKPSVVVNTCGPFRPGEHGVATQCIAQRVHYVDLADGRDFVTGITALDRQARENRVCVISGASTVPCLSSAVIEHYRQEFSEIEYLKYGITPGQKTARGLATTKSIMTYVGKTGAACGMRWLRPGGNVIQLRQHLSA